MNLRQELLDSIRASILSEVIAELRAEVIDELREQARNEILEEMEVADVEDNQDATREELVEEYFNEHRGTMFRQAEAQAKSAVASLKNHCDEAITYALTQLKARIVQEFKVALQAAEQQMKTELQSLAAQLRSELRLAHRDEIRAEVQSLIRDILNERRA